MTKIIQSKGNNKPTPDTGIAKINPSKPGQMADTAEQWVGPAKSTNIIPRESVAGNSLTLVIGIMTFLVCITFGAVSLISDTASLWKNQIAREVTIQIRPTDGADMDELLKKAKAIASQSDGVASVSIIDEATIARLLEPWLGSGLNLDDLPVPRLLSITLTPGERPDFTKLRQQLSENVEGASLDDHQAWAKRLTSMAGATVTIGIIVMILMLSATVLTVVFATRGAMSGNRQIIEVLHFVGALEGYIAGQFQKHFLLLGLKGGLVGGISAILVFLLVGYWTGENIATPEGDQAAALFGTFSVGWTGYSGVIVIVFFIALFTAITSRLTVLRHLENLDR